MTHFCTCLHGSFIFSSSEFSASFHHYLLLPPPIFRLLAVSERGTLWDFMPLYFCSNPHLPWWPSLPMKHLSSHFNCGMFYAFYYRIYHTIFIPFFFLLNCRSFGIIMVLKSNAVWCFRQYVVILSLSLFCVLPLNRHLLNTYVSGIFWVLRI